MKRFDVVTLFPQLFGPFLAEGLLGKAIRGGLVAVELVDFRRHGLGRHHNVDDVPYGGGAGMVLRPEPVFAAVRERRALHKAEGRRIRTVLVTPQGRRFRQSDAVEFAAREDVTVFVCGRYEGFDERIRAGLADEEISLGDFVCLGGEVPVMAMLEAVVRLVPGVLGNPESSAEESFAQGMLEYPHYTRPPEFEGLRVPDVLLSGNHAEIARWREAEARQRTAERRPDLATGKQAPVAQARAAEPAARRAVAQATGPRRARAGRA